MGEHAGKETLLWADVLAQLSTKYSLHPAQVKKSRNRSCLLLLSLPHSVCQILPSKHGSQQGEP